VVDHDRLADLLAQALAKRARDEVDDAAGRVRHDHLDGASGPGLRGRAGGGDEPRDDGKDLDHFLSSSLSLVGVTGNCVTAPGRPSASSIAEAITAPTAFTPASPAPFTPRPLSGLGASSVMSTCTGGISFAVGIR